MEGGRLMMDDGRGICFVLPSRQSLGDGVLIPRDFILGPRDFIPGLHAPLYGVFQTLFVHNKKRRCDFATSPKY